MADTQTDNPSADLFSRLPQRFTYAEALEATFNLEYSKSWLQVQLEKALHQGKIQRDRRGVYEKMFNT